MTELISAVESVAAYARQKQSLEPQVKRYNAFVVIVGGGAIVVFLVVFFHSPEWKVIQERTVAPLVGMVTILACIAVLGVILWFHFTSGANAPKRDG